MSLSLYRKYRPQTFADVVDQNHIKVTLQHMLERGSIAHALIFSGPRGVGKTTIARLLAKAVNCNERAESSSEPCNTCDHCREINEGRFFDVMEIDAASHTGVDTVRESIIETVRFVPQRGRYKVFIIDEVHMLSLSAFNALLKTLEEPPEHVLFILATTELHKVPETILSRCQRFDFRRVGVQSIVELLRKIVSEEKRSVEEGVLKTVASRSDGFVRDAIALLDQVLTLPQKKITQDDVEVILPHSDTKHIEEFLNALFVYDSSKALSLVSELVQDGRDLDIFVLDLLHILRSFLLTRASGLAVLRGKYDERLEVFIGQKSSELESGEIILLLERFSIVLEQQKRSVIQQLPLEMAIVSFCDREDRRTVAPPSSGASSTGQVEDSSNQSSSESVESTPSSAPAINVSMDIESVRQHWPNILEAVKEHKSLHLLLRVVYPVDVRDGRLELGCEYDFHREQLEDTQTRSLFEKISANVFGTQFAFRAVTLPVDKLKHAKDAVKEYLKKQDEPDSAPEVQSLLKEFGGSVVE